MLQPYGNLAGCKADVSVTVWQRDCIYCLVLSIWSLNNIQSDCKKLIVFSANKTLFTTIVLFLFYGYFSIKNNLTWPIYDNICRILKKKWNISANLKCLISYFSCFHFVFKRRLHELFPYIWMPVISSS